MDEFPALLMKILSQTATVHIYSFPHFTLETFLAIVMFFIYAYLHFEISKIAKCTLRLRPNTVQYRKFLRECNSRESICTSITRVQHEYCTFNVSRCPSSHLTYKRLCSNYSNHSQCGWILPQTNHYRARNPTSERFETIASLTPAEYVKRDKEKRLRERELQRCFQSLTTLYDNVVEKKFSEKTLTTQLEMAKEQTQCTKMAPPSTLVTLPCDAMTTSLFDLLEKIIVPSSVNNPLPFHGDLTSLALDAGNINPKQNPIYDTTQHLVANHSSTSIESEQTETEVY
ncbi:hypothetical protein Trydic_g1942 [Trypoxylus dichotomus]